MYEDPEADPDANDVPPVGRAATVEIRASHRYSTRERQVLMALAFEVANNPDEHPAERALARRRLTTPALEDADVEKLTTLELDTLDALLAKLMSDDTCELDLRVVGEPREHACVACAERSNRMYLDITDLDVDVRESLIEGVNRYLGEQHDQSSSEHRAQRRLSDGRD